MTELTLRLENADAETVWKACQPLLRADYVRWVRDTAEGIRKESPSPHSGDRSDAIHEAADGSWWSTYTYASLIVLASTNEDDAYFEDYGPGDLGQSSQGEYSASRAYQQLAFAAQVRDLTAEVERQDRENAPDDAEDVTSAP
jgi:hypothetical protein